jgi:hypothetical protein
MSVVDPDQKDWRLQVALAIELPKPALGGLLERVRGPSGAIGDAESAASDDVVVTHDGSQLFAYAADEQALANARAAIEAKLREDGVEASARVSHWDDELDAWRQVDPPLTDEERQALVKSDREAETVETRTLVVKVGREIRSEFEASIQNSAAELGLDCKIVEHPHLLRVQVAFTVTGPHRKVDEFAAGLNAEEWQSIRIEQAVMSSPL